MVLLNIGGAIPGKGTMAIFGGANRYTNIVLAEDEDGLPAGWEPLNVSYFGSARGTNTVAVHPVNSSSNINETSVGTAESALSTLFTCAGNMSVPNWNYWWDSLERMDGSPGILLIGRETAKGLAKFGWSKQKVQRFLWENSKLPWSIVKNACPARRLEELIEANKPHLSVNEPWPITTKAENIMIVVAGGQQSGHAYWMQVGTGYKPACRQIRLPAKGWDKLLEKAEEDLGPIGSDNR